MNTVRLERPVITSDGVTLRWSGTGALYREPEVRIALEQADRIPERFWILIAMLGQCTHWCLLRPVQVCLPCHLSDSELARWQGLLEIVCNTLDATRDDQCPQGQVELINGDLILPDPHPIPANSRVAACFSGGRDSMVQAGLLRECGHRPLLVATTSPMPPLNDHQTPRRREVLRAMANHPDFELLEVTATTRANWDNGFSFHQGYSIPVNCMTDTLVYLTHALAAAYLHHYGLVVIASEREVSENRMVNGKLVLFDHFMYALPVLAAADALVKPWGLSVGSMTSALHGVHLQALLWKRYPDLAKYQYSCWRVGPEQSACSACSKCLLCGLGALAAGGDPEWMGINLVDLLLHAQTYEPKWMPDPEKPANLKEKITHDHHQTIVRYFGHLTLFRLAVYLVRHPRLWRRASDYSACFCALARIRRAFLPAIEPTRPTWNRADLLFVPQPLREACGRIFTEALPDFEDHPADEVHCRNREACDWITGKDRTTPHDT